ncbi:MAG: hypothetical protein LBF60_05215 [Treponema sp.]|nr:hypothetical protein [Treponema sp.]
MPHEGLLPVPLHQRDNRPVNLLLEENRVAALAPPPRFRLDLITEVGGSQEPLAGAHGSAIDRANLETDPLLVNEFDGGREIIQEGARGLIDPCEGLAFRGGVETGAADIVPDAFEVFLFDETGVVFL